MHEAAQLLVGTHDFSTFRAAQCQAKSPIKTLERLDVARYGELIEVRAEFAFISAQSGSFDGWITETGG